MSNKFNANALTEYSKSYARRIAADFYQQHATISGQQMLTLTPITQINLFVISTLSDKWQADTEKFRSPYFDFTNAEVQEALQNFMNVVSQHISVRREHLEPLLIDATRRTIIMLFDPRAYFDDVLRGQPDFTLTAASLKQLMRYTKINQFIPAYIAQRMNGKPFVYVNQALNYLDEALAQRGHELEHYDKFVGLFSEKVPMDVAALLRSHVPDSIPAAPARSFFDTAAESSVPPAPLVSPEVTLSRSQNSGSPTDNGKPSPSPTVQTPRADTVTAESAGVDASGVDASGLSDEHKAESRQAATRPESANQTLTAPTEDAASGGPLFLSGDGGPEPVAPVSQPSPLPTGALTQPATAERLPSSTSTDQASTLNDALRGVTPAEAVTVAETFHRAPIESIGRSISLNQKFRFINQLFNGNASAYNAAIEEIDTLNNYGQALDLISYRYASQYLWDMSSDEVSELVEILKRRFS